MKGKISDSSARHAHVPTSCGAMQPLHHVWICIEDQTSQPPPLQALGVGQRDSVVRNEAQH